MLKMSNIKQKNAYLHLFTKYMIYCKIKEQGDAIYACNHNG